MRVIAGRAKGRQLQTPKGMSTRPTGAKVREAIFSVLASKITNKRVLDVFAGTGAMGLEALSRGAKEATFIEKDRAAQKALKQNIENIGFCEEVKIFNGDCLKFLPDMRGPFDLVFLDPPYNKGYVNKIMPLLAKPGFLAQEGIIVLETAAKEKEIPADDCWLLQKESKYGDTAVLYYQKANEEDYQNG